MTYFKYSILSLTTNYCRIRRRSQTNEINEAKHKRDEINWWQLEFRPSAPQCLLGIIKETFFYSVKNCPQAVTRQDRLFKGVLCFHQPRAKKQQKTNNSIIKSFQTTGVTDNTPLIIIAQRVTICCVEHRRNKLEHQIIGFVSVNCCNIASSSPPTHLEPHAVPSDNH